MLGGLAGTYAGVRVGSVVGSEVGGHVGGYIGSEVGGAVGAASTVHGMLFQLADGVVLAIEYNVGRKEAAEVLSYHLVVQPKT